MQVLEKSIERKFTQWLKKNKIKWKKKAPGELLDRWLLLPAGHLFIVELKRSRGKLLRRQIKEIKELRQLGYDVEVHDNADEAIEAVKIRLEAAFLSEKGDTIRAGKLLRRSISRSRVREDKYHPSRNKDIKERKDRRLRSDCRTVTRVLFCLAKRD